jgi:hypothetical protein
MVWNLDQDLYYKLITIVNDNSSIVNKLETLLFDDARVVIFDRHMFIVQTTGPSVMKLYTTVINEWSK